MNLDLYIAALQEIRAEHGNLSVQTYNPFRGRQPARVPAVAFTKLLVGRERKPAFYADYQGAERRGEKVVEV